MLIDEETVYRIIQDTWASTLGFQVDRLSLEEFSAAGAFTVCVKTTGAWDGEVRLYCSRELAGSIATAIFQIDPENIGNGEILDALSELIHIVGGNLKALLPHPVTLSLPALSEPGNWEQTTPQWQMVCGLTLACEDNPFVVTLLGGAAAAAREESPVQRRTCTDPSS
jgi:chemotaxis protein CheX